MDVLLKGTRRNWARGSSSDGSSPQKTKAATNPPGTEAAKRRSPTFNIILGAGLAVIAGSQIYDHLQNRRDY